MKRYLYLFLALWGTFLALMTLQKPLFMLFEPGYGDKLTMIPQVMWHGLGMDLAVASYLVAPVLLWLIARIWAEKRWMDVLLSVWLWIAGTVIAVASVIDAVLFPYWGFRLDSTPLFYFMSSPAAACASLPWWGNILVIILAGGLAWGFGFVLNAISWRLRPMGKPDSLRRRIWMTVCAVVIGALLIIPIRGGLTVSTMSPGRAYFSNDMALNNAALNPLFNFIYSVSHSDNLSDRFRYYDNDKATSLVRELYRPDACGDSLPDIKLRNTYPDIYIIVLESFSAHLMPSLGGEAIATGLDSLAREGVLFTNFYAESFRTDRALPTVLSGYPAQPTTSMLRFVRKFSRVPSLATALKPMGYKASYYYGGDIDFTNLGAYLVASGFDKIVSDKDFPLSKRMSKWGAHDGEVYTRLLDDLRQVPAQHAPQLTVVQTSSSHEPFEVPFDRFDDNRKNAFAYADCCLKDFTDSLKASGQWERSLIVIVPDHWGSYPRENTEYLSRHHVPLVITGGAVIGAPCRIGRIGSQSAIAGTILGLLGTENKLFPLSRNLLDPRQPQWAWMCEPTWYGMLTPSGLTVIDVANSALLESSSDSRDSERAKAFVQKLYDDLDSR